MKLKVEGWEKRALEKEVKRSRDASVERGRESIHPENAALTDACYVELPWLQSKGEERNC